MSLMLLITLFTIVYSHSWLHCVDYRGNLEDFEPDQCLGNPRPLAGNRNVDDSSFGQDIGMDFRPQDGGARCQGDAASATPVVTYEAGRTYTLAWPPKNHVAADCTNPFIPDNFLRLYMAPYTGTDPDQDTFKQNQVPASFSNDPHVGGTVDMKGFQNCPKFCENTDKALCTGTITIPADARGTYTFQWYWAFNSPTDLYATCFEANIVAPTQGGGPQNTALPQTTPASSSSTIPPNCNNCCVPGEIVAPGTGLMLPYGAIQDNENLYVDCPSGFSGQIKFLCLMQEARVVDGYCVPNSASSTGDSEELRQSKSAVTGLALTLVFVVLAFCLYVAFTQGWIALGDCATDEALPPRKIQYDVEDGHSGQPMQSIKQRPGRAASVVTKSGSELPVNVPMVWHYVNEQEQSVGPVSEKDLLAWARAHPQNAQSAYVWNGQTVAEWTPLGSVPHLATQI